MIKLLTVFDCYHTILCVCIFKYSRSDLPDIHSMHNAWKHSTSNINSVCMYQANSQMLCYNWRTLAFMFTKYCSNSIFWFSTVQSKHDQFIVDTAQNISSLTFSCFIIIYYPTIELVFMIVHKQPLTSWVYITWRSKMPNIIIPQLALLMYKINKNLKGE